MPVCSDCANRGECNGACRRITPIEELIGRFKHANAGAYLAHLYGVQYVRRLQAKAAAK